MSALAMWEEPELPSGDQKLLESAREAFLSDPHYVIDMMHAANRVRLKRKQQRKRAEAAASGR